MNALVFCYYNNFNSEERFVGLASFLKHLPKMIEVIPVELNLTGDFVIDLPGTIRVSSGDHLFHKEHLLNLGIKKARDLGCKKVIWADADIYLDQKMVDFIFESLEDHNIVQGYSNLVHRFYTTTKNGLDRQVKEVNHVSVVQNIGQNSNFMGGMGGLWGARLDSLDVEYPLFPGNVLGGGDSAFAYALFMSSVTTSLMWVQTEEMKAFFLDWAKRTEKLSGRKVSCVDQTLVTFPHGLLENRKYVPRHKLLDGLTPDMLEFPPDSGVKWTDKAPPLLRHNCEQYLRVKES